MVDKIFVATAFELVYFIMMMFLNFFSIFLLHFSNRISFFDFSFLESPKIYNCLNRKWFYTLALPCLVQSSSGFLSIENEHCF